MPKNVPWHYLIYRYPLTFPFWDIQAEHTQRIQVLDDNFFQQFLQAVSLEKIV